MRRFGGVAMTVTGFLACPCYLIVTLPLLAALFAGTALGTFLTQHTRLLYTLTSIYLLGALALGAWLWFGQARMHTHGAPACPTCLPQQADERFHGQSEHPEVLPLARRAKTR
jgi:hypothetical protein